MSHLSTMLAGARAGARWTTLLLACCVAALPALTQQPLETLLVGIDHRTVTSLDGDWHYLVNQPPAKSLYTVDGKVRDNGMPYAKPATPQPSAHFHLAPRMVTVPPITNRAMLEMLEGLCRYDAQWQDGQGAVIDPYLNREIQYATPYFAFGVGTLVQAGRAADLLPRGVAAMDHATRQIGAGHAAIPDEHGEFFLASLAEALPVYRALVPAKQWNLWRDRLRLPIAQLISDRTNNWRTYAMKGEWLRASQGLVSRPVAVAFIEHSWLQEQAERFAQAPTFLYHDRSSDPDTPSVALVGEGNLLSLVLEGYDGPSAPQIRRKVLDALSATLLMVDPSGQVAANGRTDDHVFVDTGLQLACSAAAILLLGDGDIRTAAEMERTAQLSFTGMQRWRRTDGPWVGKPGKRWDGSYSITKNQFDPALRVGYQSASQETNYTGALIYHLAEMYRLRHAQKARPATVLAPAEVGGYALELDSQFATAFANAGGLQVQFNLRGQTGETNGNWWTPLGVVRIARSGWDTRLGPSDGAQTATDAVSFAPEFLKNGKWTRLEQLPKKYQATWTVQTVNPAIVRATLEYRPVDGSGPSFRDRFVLTPDGMLSTVEPIGEAPASWAATLPLLVNDGQPLKPSVGGRLAETSYPAAGQGLADTESFLALDSDTRLDATASTVRSTYGDLLPVRLERTGDTQHTFVYPHDRTEPSASAVLASFRLTKDGFDSILGRVSANVYVGATFAGGTAKEVDIKGNGTISLRFNQQCGFVLRRRGGRVSALETDRDVEAELDGRTVHTRAYQPIYFDRDERISQPPVRR